MAHSQTPAAPLPDKLYFRVGETSRITGVAPYVLRFWETEFPGIRPKRSPSGQRMYRRQDVELIQTIKHLLYDRKFTIPGARQHLKNKTALPQNGPASLSEIRAELEAIRDLLGTDGPKSVSGKLNR